MRSFAVLGLASLVCLAFVGCGDDDSATPNVPDGGGGVDTGTPPTTPPGVPPPPGTDAGVDSGSEENLFRVLHLADTPDAIDICLSDSATFTTPLLMSMGLPGSPKHAMSAAVPFPVALVGKPTFVRFVDATAGSCATAIDGGDFGASTYFPNRVAMYAHNVRTSEGLYGPSYAPTAGKDTLVYHGVLPMRAATFTPAGGAAVALDAFDKQKVIDVGAAGVLTTTGSGTPDVTRPFKTVAGGLVHVLGYADSIVVCDLLAPPVGGLTPCGATVRAP